jgi:hypothetical protein
MPLMAQLQQAIPLADRCASDCQVAVSSNEFAKRSALSCTLVYLTPAAHMATAHICSLCQLHDVLPVIGCLQLHAKLQRIHAVAAATSTCCN